MRARLRRLLLALIGILAAMGVAGCDVTGTMKLRADDQVELDLRVVVEAGQSCSWELGPGVRTGERRNRNGVDRLCMLQGTVPKDQLRRWGVDITHNGEHISAVYNPLGVSSVGGRPSFSVGLQNVGVVVEFPGPVLESTGVVEGNTVRFTDIGQLTQPQGLRALGLDHAGPPLAIVVPIVAFVLGGLFAAAIWGAYHRQSLQAVGAQAVLGAPPAGTVPADPVMRRAPGSLLPADLAGELAAQYDDALPSDATGWERPGSMHRPPPAPGVLEHLNGRRRSVPADRRCGAGARLWDDEGRCAPLVRL